MKGKQLLARLLVLVTVVAALTPVNLFADSLGDITKKQQEAQAAGSAISSELEDALQQVSDTYTEIDNLNTEITDTKAQISQTQVDIEASKEKIEKRKAVVAERLQALQVSNTGQQKMAMLLEAKSISEFINRALLISQMQAAENEKMNSLIQEQENLDSLMAQLEDAQQALTTKEGTLQSEVADLSTQVTGLQAQFAKNQDLVAQLATEKTAEEQRIADEKAAQEKAAKEAAEKAEQEKAAAKAAAEKQAASDKNSSTSNNNDSSSSNTGNSSNANEDSSSSEANTGNSEDNSNSTPSGSTTFSMETTAYSFSEAGASPFTASGIDLRTYQGGVIAVDPSVIPLGTQVYVEGYGVAIAADTGGAIKGNIIDLHFRTVGECYSWGRRYNVKVTVLKWP